MFVIKCLTEAGRSPFPTQYEMMLVARIKQHGVNLKAKLEPEHMSLNLAYEK